MKVWYTAKKVVTNDNVDFVRLSTTQYVLTNKLETDTL